MSDARRHLSEEFESLVREKFSFLQSDYGYEQRDTYFPDLQISHGDRCAVRFANSDVGICIEVYLDFEVYIVEVVLFESPDGSVLEHSVWGQTHLASAILLSALIDSQTLRSPDDDLLPPSLPSMSWREKHRRLKQRRTMVHEQLADVVEDVADHLDKFAADVLRGDTSLFPEIQGFYRKQQNVTLSPDGRRVELGF